MSRASWFADVSAWAPGSSDWQRAVQLLPPHEQQQIARFVFAKDQRLALGSRLLQRRLVSSVSSSPASPSLAHIDLRRTPERKPFWRRDGDRIDGVPPTWNFNVSHHGAVVAIASHPRRLVGVDVVQLSERPRSGRVRDFFRAFERHFTAHEWAFIRAHGCGGDDSNVATSAATATDEGNDDDDDRQFERFYTLWSLKEAYIKAVGIGLGFELLRAEFAFSNAQQRWQLRLDGALASDWTFEATRIDTAHLVSLALGPLSAMWSPTTSSIFPSCVDTETEESDTNDGSAKGFDGRWERKELADLIA